MCGGSSEDAFGGHFVSLQSQLKTMYRESVSRIDSRVCHPRVATEQVTKAKDDEELSAARELELVWSSASNAFA